MLAYLRGCAELVGDHVVVFWDSVLWVTSKSEPLVEHNEIKSLRGLEAMKMGLFCPPYWFTRCRILWTNRVKVGLVKESRIDLLTLMKF